MTNKSFSNNRKTTYNLDKLKNKLSGKKDKSDKKAVDERFWKPYFDTKTQTGEATIRFLPGINFSIGGVFDPTEAYVEVHRHIFKAAGGWMHEVCPNTAGIKCPVCAHASALYEEDTEQSKAIARNRKKQTKFYANVLIVDDPANPENNGQVKIFEFGPDIFKRINSKIEAEDEEDTSFVQVVPFAIDERGAEYKLKIHFEDGYRKYTKSFYKKNSYLENAEEVLAKQHDLDEYLQSQIALIKPSEQLESRLAHVLKEGTPQTIDDKTAEPKSEKKVSSRAPKVVEEDEEDEADDILSSLDELLED